MDEVEIRRITLDVREILDDFEKRRNSI